MHGRPYKRRLGPIEAVGSEETGDLATSAIAIVGEANRDGLPVGELVNELEDVATDRVDANVQHPEEGVRENKAQALHSTLAALHVPLDSVHSVNGECLKWSQGSLLSHIR